VLFGQHRGRSDGRHGRCDFVLHPCDHIAFGVHHRFEADASHFVRGHFLLQAYLGIEHLRTIEELGLGGPGIRQVTVAPVSFNSLRKAQENESMNALVPLYTA
jgi:hypothetical protein